MLKCLWDAERWTQFPLMTSTWILVAPASSLTTTLQVEPALHLVCNHFSYGEGGGSGWRGSVTNMENPTAHDSNSTVEHKVIHKVSITIEGLSSNSCRTPGQETNRFTTGQTVTVLLN